MSERPSRRSRFRRSSRFRTPKSPDDAQDSPEEGEEGDEGEGEGEDKKEEPPQPPTIASPPAEVPFSGVEPGIPDSTPLMPTSTNVLTVDVEEWFQTFACSTRIKFSHWSKCERRVETGIHIILSLLKEFNVKGTFFILGIIAREFPELVKMIAAEGHEIGVKGYYNRVLHTIPPKDYIKELEMSLALLKNIINRDVVAHRAPEWSVTAHTLWAIDAIKSFNIKYDSSIYPVNSTYYGIEEAPRFPYVLNPSGIIEFPPTTVSVAGKNIAFFSGAYLRVLPYGLISLAMKSLNHSGHSVMVRVTPWEMEADFPKLDLGWDGFVSQYAGIKSTLPRLERLLEDFRFDTMSRVLEENPPVDSFHINNIAKQRMNAIR